MTVAIVVPWRPGDDVDRETAWELVQDRYRQSHPSWPIIEGTSPAGPWCKAAAVTDALQRSAAETVIVHDADVWTDGLDLAVAAINRDTRWAIPHDLLYRLAENQLEPTTDRDRLAQKPYRGFAGGGIVVIDRDAYEHCPLDPRFVGWGQEDESWALALTCLYGQPWRGDAPLWHWWHPPQHRQNRRVGSPDSARLNHRYRQAAKDRRQMVGLLEEAIACTQNG